MGLIDSARDEGAFASPTKDRRAWLRLLAREEARYTLEREQDAIEAEDYWGQAEEACTIDPIG
jgi:hypothetical protein